MGGLASWGFGANQAFAVVLLVCFWLFTEHDLPGFTAPYLEDQEAIQSSVEV